MNRALLLIAFVAGCASNPPAPERTSASASDAGVSDRGLARSGPVPAGAEPQGTPDAPFRAQPPPPSAPVAFHAPVPRIAKLSNGLAVWIVEYHEVPLVTVDLVVKSGSDTEGSSQAGLASRSEEHTSELQSQRLISYAVFCLKKKKKNTLYPQSQ